MTPFDLHALGTPPALILSQDQTLHQIHPAHQIPRCLGTSGSHGACCFRCPPHQSTQRARPHDPAHHAVSTSALLLLPLQRLTQLCSGQNSVWAPSSLLNPRCQASHSPSKSPTKLPAHWVHAHLSRCCAIVAFSAIFARRFERRPHLYPACLTVSSALRVRIDPIVIGIFSGPHQRRRRY